MLKDILARCKPCQRINSDPKQFHVFVGANKIIFNKRVYLDVMCNQNNPVLYVVDEAKTFPAAMFVPGLSTKQIWDTFQEGWCSIYTDILNQILVDQGTSFDKSFVVCRNLCNVEVSQTGTKSHNFLGLDKCSYRILRNMFRKITITQAHIIKKL